MAAPIPCSPEPSGHPIRTASSSPTTTPAACSRCAFGQTRTGLLEDKQDPTTTVSISGHWDQIRLTIEPPPDGEIMADLYWDKSGFKQFNAPQTGQKVELEGLFPPGDYYLALNAKKTSEAEYKLSLERLDRFGCPTDCEPNDNLDFASPLPADHVLEGRASEWRDSDWYRLPVFDQPTEITLACEPRQALQVRHPRVRGEEPGRLGQRGQSVAGNDPGRSTDLRQDRRRRTLPLRGRLPEWAPSQARTWHFAARDGDDIGDQGSRCLPCLRTAGRWDPRDRQCRRRIGHGRLGIGNQRLPLAGLSRTHSGQGGGKR